MTSRWITAAILLASPLLAQEQTLLPEPGNRVRVTARADPEGPRVVTYWGLRDDGRVVFTAEDSEDEWTISPSEVATLEVYEGRKGRFWKGAAVGLVAVGTAATVICAGDDSPPGTLSDPKLCYKDVPFGEALAAGVVLGLSLGVPVGGIVGSLIRYDKWVAVDMPRARPVVASRPNGVFVLGFTVPLRR